MHGDGHGFHGSRWMQLHHLDSLLTQLARPWLPDAGIPPGLRDQLRALGLRTGRAARREDVIGQLWSRKRPILRELSSSDDPIPPCA